MKPINFIYFIVFFVLCLFWNNPTFSQPTKYIVDKKNGKIVLAYKAFENYLGSEKTWEKYKETVLDPFPEMQYLHKRRLYWGAIDSLTFPQEVEQFKNADFKKYLNPEIDKYFINLYDSIIPVGNKLIKLDNYDTLNMCLFLPYNSCFVKSEKGKNTIFISLKIDKTMIPLIIAHEYGHCLHFQLNPEEEQSLRTELVSEGMAVFLSHKILDNSTIKNSIPFMPESTVEWCIKNENQIRDSIYNDLGMTGDAMFAKYISDGSFAKPPKGFPEKTAYYIGFRIIESCIEKNISLIDLCTLSAQEVIRISGYFK
ncbi:MAG: hypothetical protein HQ541_19380 [Mariniphaga sp.]|nr:hypothetical protein [Mariniphaga sp.]